DKTVETQKTWARLYPDDFIPHNNLSLNYKILGNFDESLKEGLEAVRLSPNNTSARDNVVESFIGLGRIDEAEQAVGEVAKINPDALSVHFPRYLFAFLRRDQAGMDREVQWSKGRPEEAEGTLSLAATAAYFGKLKQAEDHMRRGNAMFKA